MHAGVAKQSWHIWRTVQAYVNSRKKKGKKIKNIYIIIMGIFAYLFYYYYYFSWAFIKLKLLLSCYDVRVINGSTFALPRG